MFVRSAEERRREAGVLASEPRAGVIVSDGVKFQVTEGALRLAPAGAFALEDLVFLGRLDGAPIFTVPGQPDEGALDFRGAAMSLPDDQAEILFFAKAMLTWIERTRFCSRCGATLAAASAGYTRRCTSAGCAVEWFPRLDPAVIMLVTDGSRVLLGRHHRFAAAWTTFAGFVEAGETIEQAAERELAEETGLRATSLRYLGSQPWPMPSSLMVGFRVEAEGELRVDLEELIEARWFTRDELIAGVASGETPISQTVSIAGKMIRGWMSESNSPITASRTSGAP
jgi:NAD+ diphosphatase